MEPKRKQQGTNSNSVQPERKKRRTSSHSVEPERKKDRTRQNIANIRTKCLTNDCILRSIFVHLKTDEKVVAAGVCKLWRDIIYLPPMWRDNDSYINMDKVDFDIMAPSLKRREITRFKLSSLARNDGDSILQFLDFIGSLGPSIKSLDMKKFKTGIKEPILKRALTWKTLPSLETLHLQYKPTIIIKVICERYPCLKSLHVNSCDELDDSILTLIGKNLTALTDLDIAGCKYITDVGIYNISSCLPHLTALTIDASRITNTGVSHLARFPLRKLSMRLCFKIDENCINALSPLRNSLQSLNISQCKNINPNLALHHIANSGFCLTEITIGIQGYRRLTDPSRYPNDIIDGNAIKYFLQKAGRTLKKIDMLGKIENSALIDVDCIDENCPELILLQTSWPLR